MQNQPSLTIVSVTGRSDYTRGSMFAIQASYIGLKDKISNLKCLLISPDRPVDLPEYIHHIRCQLMNYKEYNGFVFHSLGKFIDTDFALIVQNDGWVIEPTAWTNEFFNYDYIGAPIGIYIKPGQSYEIVDDNIWRDNYHPIPDGLVEPQNGGFCLRSKRLLDAPKQLGIRYTVDLDEMTEIEPIKFVYRDNNPNEDVLLSGQYRFLLEQHGFRFAPRDIALRFSIENSMPLMLYNHFFPSISPKKIFGAHTSGLAILTGWKEVTTNLPYVSIENLCEDMLCRSLLEQGYLIRVEAKFSFNGKAYTVKLS